LASSVKSASSCATSITEQARLTFSHRVTAFAKMSSLTLNTSEKSRLRSRVILDSSTSVRMEWTCSKRSSVLLRLAVSSRATVLPSSRGDTGDRSTLKNSSDLRFTFFLATIFSNITVNCSFDSSVKERLTRSKLAITLARECASTWLKLAALKLAFRNFVVLLWARLLNKC